MSDDGGPLDAAATPGLKPSPDEKTVKSVLQIKRVSVRRSVSQAHVPQAPVPQAHVPQAPKQVSFEVFFLVVRKMFSPLKSEVERN